MSRSTAARRSLLSAAIALTWGGACEKSGPASDSRPAAPAAVLAKAEELASEELFVEAANLLRSAAPGAPAAERGPLYLRAARYYHRGNVPQLALKCAEDAAAQGAGGLEASYIAGDARRILCEPNAREVLEKLVRDHPDHALARLSLARLLFRADDPAAALPHFEAYFAKASPKDPEYGEALVEEGRALRAAGRLEEAIDRFARRLEEEPLERDLYSELAATLYRMKRREEGKFIERIYRAIAESSFEEHVEEGLLETGSTAFALGQRALNRARQKRFLEAFRSHEAACRASPADPRLRIHHAGLCLRFRRRRDARETLEAALRLYPQPRSGLLSVLGRVLVEETKSAEALRILDDAANALAGEGDLGGPERGQAVPAELARAKEAALSGGSSAAEPIRARVRELETAIDTTPLLESGAHYLALGKLLLEARDPQAYDLLLLASDLMPGSAEALVLVLSGLTRPEDVFVRLQYLRRLLELQPDNDTALAAALEIYQKLRLRPDEAARIARRLRDARAAPRPAPTAPGEARGERAGGSK